MGYYSYVHNSRESSSSSRSNELSIPGKMYDPDLAGIVTNQLIDPSIKAERIPHGILVLQNGKMKLLKNGIILHENKMIIPDGGHNNYVGDVVVCFADSPDIQQIEIGFGSLKTASIFVIRNMENLKKVVIHENSLTPPQEFASRFNSSIFAVMNCPHLEEIMIERNAASKFRTIILKGRSV